VIFNGGSGGIRTYLGLNLAAIMSGDTSSLSSAPPGLIQSIESFLGQTIPLEIITLGAVYYLVALGSTCVSKSVT